MVSQLQSSLDYPDSLELEETVRMIEGPDNPEDEYKPIRPHSSEHSSDAFAFSKQNKLAFTTLFNAVVLKRLWFRISIMTNKYS